MLKLRAVTFHFRRDMELRYLTQVPKLGDLVSHGDDLWAVVDVYLDALGTTVVCERRGKTDRHLRLVA